jgi:CBS domain containing-hemolysin-like protein
VIVPGSGLGFAIAGLLSISAFFSGSETALFSIPAHRIRDLSRSEHPGDRAAARLMESPRRILVTILLGNMVVNLLVAALGAALAMRLWGEAGLALAVPVMTIVLLVFGEIAPKMLAVRHGEGIGRVVARPLLFLRGALGPVQWILERAVSGVLGPDRDPEAGMNLGDARAMVRIAHEAGEVGKGERELIEGVFELGASPVEDVMTPRSEMFSLPPDQSVADARNAVRRAGFSKIPVSSETPAVMVGVVTARQLLAAPDDERVGELARRVRYIPEVTPAMRLLESFRETGERIAFVVNEHGDLAGIVTLVDLMEEISGEMVEAADLHKVIYRRTGAKCVEIPGRMEIRYFNSEFGTDLSAEDAETMAGLLIERLGRIPRVGDSYRTGGLRVRVTRAEPNRVERLEVTFPNDGQAEAGQGR